MIPQRRVEPRASDIVNALRSIGYTTQAAVADLVDNSIAAGATETAISFQWRNGLPVVLIRDNGRGMTQAALFEAMRMGKDPRVRRDAADLGRFGLGLKTASFSQARSLTVTSITDGSPPATGRWDIDIIEEQNDWTLLETSSEDVALAIAALGTQKQGTLVAWEKADSLVASAQGDYDRFLEIVDRVSAHLGTVFERFLTSGRLKITVNDAVVVAWDPFLRDHASCVATATETISAPDGQSLAFTGYTLPPASKLTAEEFESASGEHGWIQSQGFYLYRGDRLIVAGGWLGLGRGSHKWRPDRDHQLARISLDISNAADLDWQIDIPKGAASLPLALQTRVRQLATQSRQRAKSALRTFGSVERKRRTRGAAADAPIWIPSGKGAGTQFRLNRRHPLLSEVRTAAGDTATFRRLLDEIDQYVPILPMAAAKVPQPDPHKALQASYIRKLVRTYYYASRHGQGLSHDEACERLFSHAEFRDHEWLVLEEVETYSKEFDKS
jgi:hypothetical protein